MEDVEVSQARNRLSLRLKPNLVGPKAKILVGERETYAPHTYGHLRANVQKSASCITVSCEVAGCEKGFHEGNGSAQWPYNMAQGEGSVQERDHWKTSSVANPCDVSGLPTARNCGQLRIFFETNTEHFFRIVGRLCMMDPLRNEDAVRSKGSRKCGPVACAAQASF